LATQPQGFLNSRPLLHVLHEDCRASSLRSIVEAEESMRVYLTVKAKQLKRVTNAEWQPDDDHALLRRSQAA